MNQEIPTAEDVKNHFALAKEIRCLKMDIPINITYATNYAYNEENNSYSLLNGVVVVWKDGNYATILKKKCSKDCGDCKPCKEK